MLEEGYGRGGCWAQDLMLRAGTWRGDRGRRSGKCSDKGRPPPPPSLPHAPHMPPPASPHAPHITLFRALPRPHSSTPLFRSEARVWFNALPHEGSGGWIINYNFFYVGGGGKGGGGGGAGIRAAGRHLYQFLRQFP